MCRLSADRLAAAVNEWLDRAPLSRMLQTDLLAEREAEYRVIIGTDNPLVRQIPWLLWRGWQQFPQLEISLGAVYTQRHDRIYQQQVRILVILGDSEGIDIEADRQILDRHRREGAAIDFLPQPTIDELRTQLADDRGWDIIFFSGHSSSEGHDRGRIYLDRTHSLTMAQLRSELIMAIDKGLQLAIFNSCDGLGIAAELEDLHIPQVIVMRQPVPDRVAQVFLKDFLAEFTAGKSLYRSVSIARQRLTQLEADFPCASWLPVIVQNRLEVPPTWQSLGSIPPCPYPGLAAFTAADRDYFFGRDREIEAVITAINSHAIVSIVGASGSGKSSLVFAGLVTQLESDWQIITCHPGANPIESLANAIEPILSRSDDLDSDLQQSKSALAEIIDGYLLLDAERRLLLIVDPLEDLYILNSDPLQRELFFKCLIQASERASRFKLLFAIRSDYYQQFCADFPSESISQFELKPLSKDKLSLAISQPAQKLNVRFEAGLIDKIFLAIAEQNYSLPLLQFVLSQLWERQTNGYLTDDAYREIDRIGISLSERAQKFYDRATPQQQDRIRTIFMQLVRIDDNLPDAPRSATRSEIGAGNWELVNPLVAERLLVVDSAPTLHARGEREEKVELMHGSLITDWKTYRDWINRDGDFRRWQERLRDDINRWEKNNRHREGLLRARALDLAQTQKSIYSQQISPLEAQFINLSLDRQRHEHRTKLLGGLLSISVILGGIYGAYALDRAHQATNNERIKGLTEQARSDSDPLIAVDNAKMAVASIDRQRTPTDISLPALITLAKKLDRNQLKKTLAAVHESSVTNLTYTPDGKIVSIGEDGNLNIYDRNGAKLQSLPAKNEKLSHLAIASDRKIFTVSNDRIVRLWNYNATSDKWSNEDQKITVNGNITSIALSRDSKTLAIATAKSEIELYRTDLSYLESWKASNYIYDLKFLPDNRIVVAHADGNIDILSKTGKKSLSTNTGKILSLAISKDSSKIAAGDETGKINVWNLEGKLLATNTESRLLVPIRTEITSLNFNADGRYLVSTHDKQIDIWEIDNGKLNLTTSLLGHEHNVNTAAFNEDGKTIVSGSKDGSIRLWQATTNDGDLTLPTQVSAFSYSADGKLLFLGTSKGNISIVDRQKQKIINSFLVDGSQFTDLSVEQNNRYLATVQQRKVKLWQIDEKNDRAGSLITLDGNCATFINDRLAVVNGNSLEIYDLNGKSIRSWDTKQLEISYFNSTAANILVTGDTKGVVKFWNIDGKEELKPMYVDPNPVIDISCDSAEPMLRERNCQTVAIVSGSRDSASNQVTLWSRNNRKYILDKVSGVTSISFSQDRKVLLIGDRDGNLKLLDLNGNFLASVWNGDRNDEIRKVRFSNGDREILAIDIRDRIIHLDLDSERLLERAKQQKSTSK